MITSKLFNSTSLRSLWRTREKRFKPIKKVHQRLSIRKLVGYRQSKACQSRLLAPCDLSLSRNEKKIQEKWLFVSLTTSFWLRSRTSLSQMVTAGFFVSKFSLGLFQQVVVSSSKKKFLTRDIFNVMFKQMKRRNWMDEDQFVATYAQRHRP